MTMGNRILLGIAALTMIYVSFRVGNTVGWERGADEVFKATLDSVSAICHRQMMSDTSVTELVLINPDTTTYYLTRKYVLK